MSFNVRIVGDSISPWGKRITSALVTFPRIILAEFNTHRALSRNSASSRAIPFERMIESVMTNPFIPLRWMKEHKGMQGTEYFEPDSIEASDLHDHWLEARDLAVNKAKSLSRRGLTKQICNRLLEPYMWHTCMVTATEWENFFALRAHPAAEIHMQKIAEMMLEAMNYSTPKKVQPGDWHIPFEYEISDQFGDEIEDLPIVLKEGAFGLIGPFAQIRGRIRIYLQVSTMMSARTSYTVPNTEMGEWTLQKYMEKHNQMAENRHWSPFEHCAQCPGEHEIDYISSDVTGNFIGWKQYRKMWREENSKDQRLISKLN